MKITTQKNEQETKSFTLHFSAENEEKYSNSQKLSNGSTMKLYIESLTDPNEAPFSPTFSLQIKL